MNFRTIVKTVDSLPPLGDTAQIVSRLYANGAQNVDISRLSKAISQDAILTANILKMINSPYYGLSKQISSISQAITLFGTQIIYGLVVKYAIEISIRANLRPYGITNEKFNHICQLQSRLMTQWYSQVDENSVKMLSTLALIMESGKLVVAQEIVKESKIKEFSNGMEHAENISHYENSVFGTSSYYVSGLLFEHWNLDQLYVDMLKGLDFEYDPSNRFGNYIDALDVVRTAINVKDVLTEESIENAADIVAEMGINVDNFIDIASSLKATYGGYNF